MAELFEDQSRLEEAREQYAALVADAPASETAKLRLARLLRELNRLDEARTVLESLPRQPQASVELAAEMAELELESGNYEEADRWFARAVSRIPKRRRALSPRPVSSALQEKPSRARATFRVDRCVHNRKVRMEDLVARLAIGADDPQAQDELRRLAASSPGEREPDAGPAARRPAGRARRATASGLYALHCSGCHGENGDGHGRAARHLFPKPRDLRTGRSRLVSTVNGVPSLEDLEAVIRRGMPGTSMRAFDKLSEDQRMLLAQEVRRLNRLGIGEHFIDTLVKEGEEVDENEVREVVKLRHHTRRRRPGSPHRPGRSPGDRARPRRLFQAGVLELPRRRRDGRLGPAPVRRERPSRRRRAIWSTRRSRAGTNRSRSTCGSCWACRALPIRPARASPTIN